MTMAVRVHKVGGPETLVYEVVDLPVELLLFGGISFGADRVDQR